MEYDECYGYAPLLGLGGKEKIENIEKVKISVHIALIAQLVCKMK
ncbi:T6SS immunity protein Tdi1 domain-containing protein [Chitinophaga sp. CC14]